MGEAIVAAGPHVTIIESPIPTPASNQVLIKVVVSGSNPKDWKRPEWFQKPHNSGDDIAGIVEAVGDDVTSFYKGDRVAALHEMMTLGGSYAENALAPEYTYFHLHGSISFAEVFTLNDLTPKQYKKLIVIIQAATVPLAAMTAALGLYKRMDLPPPWRPATHHIPLIIYGGAAAVGSFALTLAQASNMYHIIAIAGNSKDYVETLVSREKGDSIVDYRLEEEKIGEEIRQALSNAGVEKVEYAFDTVTKDGNYNVLSKVLAPWSQMVLVLPYSWKHRGISISSG